MSKSRITLIALLAVLAVLAVLALGYALPERVQIPVAGASTTDWHPKTFWFEPWGTSGVHKGIDIFGKMNTPVLSTTDGLVLYTGKLAKGGNVVIMLGPKWRIHYFAHLSRVDTAAGRFIKSGQAIAALGDSGNAKGKAPHLHYAILRLIPNPFAADGATQGYKKAFYLDPGAYLTSRHTR